MKVSISWLKELLDLKVPIGELVHLLPLRTIGLKGITDEYIELDMKGYNRADLLSLRGVAREVSAITDSQVLFKEPELNELIWAGKDLPQASVKVEDTKLVPLYCIAKISGLKVASSPKEWVEKLGSSGMRSVNNIADVTNLVMLEYGQPTHAFDANCIKDETIIVRSAKPGEKLTTLDNKIRQLLPEDLLITDPEKAVGLAGVMGGKNSEVTDSTHTILLEAAIFDPITIRKTADRLGLHSEASKRFQHGLTKTRLLQAVDAAIRMYQNLGGELISITLIGDLGDKVETINAREQKINSLIGINIPPEQVEKSLQKLGFNLASHSSTHSTSLSVDPEHAEGSSGNVNWDATPPYWRLDVSIEADVIEEVARMYGYENIPAQPLDKNIPTVTQDPIFDLIDNLKQSLVDRGLTEVQTYSYFSTAVTENCNLKTETLIKIANPISSETEYLKDMLWPNLVEVVAKNFKQGFKDIAIFEIGKVYFIENDLPKEKYHLSIALCNGTDNPILELNGIAKKLNLSHLGGRNEATPGVFHPNRLIKLSGGSMAEVHKRITDKFGINQRVAILEIELDKIP